MNKYRYLLITFLAASLLSCEHEQDASLSGDVAFSVAENSREMVRDYGFSGTSFYPSGPEGAAPTKAAAVYGSDDAVPLEGAPIAVWSSGMASPVAAAYDAASGKWKPTSAITLATTSGNLRWFSLAPRTAIGNGVTLGDISGTDPTFSYTVPSSAASQPDLMVAYTAPRSVNDKSEIPLSFSHVLTGVRLEADPGVVISSATLSGVYDRGTLNMLSGEWGSLSRVSGSFSFDFSSETSAVLMMIPQWLPKGAKLTMEVEDRTVEADLSGHKWLKGELVSYRVTGKPMVYHIETEVTGELSADGTPKPVATLNSYAVPEGGGDAVSAPFRVKGAYSTRELAESGATPDLDGRWTTSVDGNTLSVGAPAATPVSKTVTTLLEEAPEWGTSSHPWNLANRLNGGDAIVESANTYLVNAPGYYRIPLVIGNGVKNNTPNPAAYPSNFVDYKGQSIQNPYLHKSSAQAGTPTSGAVVWTETPGMVENLSVVSTGEGNDRVYWLQFHIPASKIAQGCTVVSVKDAGGTVMWSWLLWATDLEPGTGDVTCTYSSEGDQLSFMSRNLGWSVDTALPGVMPAEVAFVRVEVEANPEVYEIIRIRRAGGFSGELPHEGHGPLFQWGRKDAMPPTATGWNYRSAGTKKPEDLIQYPGHHFIVSYYPYCNDGGKLVATNWWSASATAAGQDVATVKTVYDPCPAGYTVPRHNAFNGFSCEPVVQNDPNNTLPELSIWDRTNLGYSFNTGYRASGSGHVYFPAQGHRNGGATSAAIGTSEASFGRYWTAVPQGGNTARRLTFEFGAVNHPQDNSAGFFSKAGEHSVRPCREE